MKKCISLFLALALSLELSVSAQATGSTFTDVPTEHWAYTQIERAYSEGVITGTYYNENTGERHFSPDEPMTMAQFVTILCRKFFPNEMETSQATTPWYAQAQEVALKHNLYDWTTEGTNGMDKPLNRYGMAQILYATLLAIGCAPTNEDMVGVSEQIADYDEIKNPTPIVGVVSLGIISGVDEKGTFAGDTYMTRAQAAVVFCRLADITEPTVAVPDEPLTEDNLQAIREKMLELVNEERSKAGVPALVLDDKLCNAAQIRAEEIIENYSHTRPDGSNWITVLDEVGISERYAGENIYQSPTSVEEAMYGWMNSEGHRANILNPKFRSLGVGFVHTNTGWEYFWVQNFSK